MSSSESRLTGKFMNASQVARFSLFLLGSLLLVSTTLWAQLYSGSVTGLIKDPSGATVPDAKISLSDQDKGFTFMATADSTGNYSVRSVPPGTYKIIVEAVGFKRQTRPGIIVDVNQNVSVDFALEIGSTTESITISTAPPLLQTEDATGGQVISRKLVDTLPLLSRNPTSLAYLTPGITSVGPGCEPSKSTAGCQGPANFVSNGGRNSTSDILLDGVTTTTFDQNSGVAAVVFTPGVDSVDEFTVQQSNFSAEYGFTGGTIVNMITRSGTNKFHGSVYDYLQNSAANARDYFADKSTKVPSVKLNDFGGTIGGPIQKNKTFFFFDYEGQRTGLPLTYSEGVPSDAMKQGDFGELCGYNGGTFDTNGVCSAAAGQLWDPFTGTYDPSSGNTTRSAFIPFNNMATYISPGNPNLAGTPYQLASTPGNLIDPVASQMMKGYPEPNLNVGLPTYNYKHNWSRSTANHTNINQFDAKIDRQFGYKNLLSGKFSLMRFSQPHWGEYGDSNLYDPVNRGDRQRKGYNVAINDTHMFSPRVVMNVSYGLAWWHGTFGPGIASVFPQVDPVKLLGMPTYMNDSGYKALPSLNPTGYGSIGTGPWTIGLQTEDTQQWRGSLSWVNGKHELKFGLEARLHNQDYTQPGTPAGLFSYDDAGTAQNTGGGSGDAMASLLTGFDATPNFAWGQYEVPNHVITSSWQTGAFIQDNWKATDRLTLNLGLRYDINLPRTERHNQMNGLDPTLVSPLQVPGMATLYGGEVFMNGNRRTSYETDYKDFAPRFGLAYRIGDKTVLRGGYGIYYSISRSGAAGVGAPGWQGYDQVTPWVYTMNSDGATPWGRLSNPFPNGPTLPVGSSLGALNDIGNAAIGPIASSGKTTPYEQSWSFGIERELPYQMVLDTSYVGKKGTHLYFGGTENLNHLGAWVEKATPAQLTALNSYVNNPLAPYITDPNAPLSAPQVQAFQLQLPFPQFTSFSADPIAAANSIYNALQVKLEKRFSKGLSLLTSYVWSKSIDDASVPSDSTASYLGGGASSLQDPNNHSLERGLSTFDQAHVFQVTYTYELPFGRGKLIGGNMNPVLNAIIGGWQTTGTWRFTDGFPIMLSQGNVQDPLPTYGAQRPNLSAPLTCNSGSDRLTNYFQNPGVVTDAPGMTLGNAPRTTGSCRTPGVANSSLALLKEFALPKFGESAKAQFRLEAYNALNHPQFAGPSTDIDNNFGLVTSTAIGPRQVQVALKVSF